MNSLTRSLISSFLTEATQETIGVFGGGFQPPTKGHFEVVKRALDENPTLDKFIIFVGTGGGRSNITQAQTAKIWEIYKNYLSPKIEIQPSANPITDIYRLAKNNPDVKIKWFLGSREGNEDDFLQFDKRTKAVDDKPNLEPINIVTANIASGTAARAVLDNKDLFFTFLPKIELKDKEEIYSILQGVSEDEEITTWVNEVVPEPEIDDIDDYADDVLDPIDIDIPPHFVDRVNDKRNRPEIEADELYDFFDKLSDEKDELTTLLDQGEVVATDLDTDINIPLTKDIRKSQLRDKVVAVAKTIMRKPNFQTTSTKLTFEQVQGDSIVCDGCGWTWKIKDGGNDLYICHKCGHDNTPKEETNNFFEPLQDKQLNLNISSEPTKVDYYKNYYKNLSPSDFKVDKDKDKIIISNINKNSLENNPEFKELLVSLTMHMMDHIDIEPLPDLIFIEDDTENAKDLLGKTAHYNPDDKSITLYTYGRHPKDILRSYAHEMIHHKQNLEGRLTNIQGHNINEDDYLKELEAEAYTYGNGLLFRGWENSLEND
jgi:hypothetical protein